MRASTASEPGHVALALAKCDLGLDRGQVDLAAHEVRIIGAPLGVEVHAHAAKLRMLEADHFPQAPDRRGRNRGGCWLWADRLNSASQQPQPRRNCPDSPRQRLDKMQHAKAPYGLSLGQLSSRRIERQVLVERPEMHHTPVRRQLGAQGLAEKPVVIFGAGWIDLVMLAVDRTILVARGNAHEALGVGLEQLCQSGAETLAVHEQHARGSVTCFTVSAEINAAVFQVSADDLSGESI